MGYNRGQSVGSVWIIHSYPLDLAERVVWMIKCYPLNVSRR